MVIYALSELCYEKTHSLWKHVTSLFCVKSLNYVS
jgi:hypothetical protein